MNRQPLDREEHVLAARHVPGLREGGAMSETTRPEVRKAAWTFDLTGECIYCGKKATRSRTYYAKSENDARAQADAAMSGLCHRKCGGY